MFDKFLGICPTVQKVGTGSSKGKLFVSHIYLGLQLQTTDANCCIRKPVDMYLKLA